MKCIHCGVLIKNNAASFCPKCKKPLKKKPVERRQIPTKKIQATQSGNQPPNRYMKPPPNHQTQKKKPFTNKKPWYFFILNPKKKKNPDLEPLPVINPMDENYDGYYDDRPTDYS